MGGEHHRLLQDALEPAGYEVVRMPSPPPRDANFDLIIVDGATAVADGSRLREWTLSRLPMHVPVLVVLKDGTALSGPELAFDDVIRRPFPREELLARVRSLLSLSAASRRAAHLSAQLAEATRELDEFTAAISHDLRAPVRAIEGFTDLLIAEHGAELMGSAGNMLLRVRGAALRLGQLIEGLALLSRASLRMPQRERVDLSQVAREVARALSAATPQRAVEFDIAPGLVAQADPAMLRQVMEILIGNAWKYTSANRSARISVGGHHEAGAVQFFVKDDGTGFDPAHAGRLFRPFERLHTEREFPGVGVGLAAAHRIIARHGGRIRGESGAGQGATFYFTLPAPRA